MKYAIALLLSAITLIAADAPKPAIDTFTVTPFYAANTEDFKDFQEGIGVGLEYRFNDRFGISTDVISYLPQGEWYGSVHDANVDEINVNLTIRQPLGKSGLGLFGLVGGGNNLEEHEWRLNAGAGLDFRYGRFSVSTTGIWVNDFDDPGHAQLRGGIGLSF